MTSFSTGTGILFTTCSPVEACALHSWARGACQLEARHLAGGPHSCASTYNLTRSLHIYLGDLRARREGSGCTEPCLGRLDEEVHVGRGSGHHWEESSHLYRLIVCANGAGLVTARYSMAGKVRLALAGVCPKGSRRLHRTTLEAEAPIPRVALAVSFHPRELVVTPEL